MENLYAEGNRKGFSSYVKNKNFEEAKKWHQSNRINPISNLVGSQFELSNYLSLEFSPFPSKNSGSVIDFVTANPNIVRKYVLEFAATASKLIEKPLKGIVFVRVTDAFFTGVLEICGLKAEELKDFEMPFEFEKIKESGKNNNTRKLMGYKIDEFPDTKFIVVTGVRNQFPLLKFKKVIN